jgi:hypothetical protein
MRRLDNPRLRLRLRLRLRRDRSWLHRRGYGHLHRCPVSASFVGFPRRGGSGRGVFDRRF